MFGKRKAILRDGRWLSADCELEWALNDQTSRWIQETGGPALRDRDQEKTVAREMVRRNNGKILLAVKSRTGRSAGYFLEQRQLNFDFDAVIPVKAKRASA